MVKKRRHALSPSFFFFVHFFSLLLLLHLMWKILPLHSVPSPFFLSVPLFLFFVCSPSLPLFLPLAHCGMQTCRNLGLKMIDQTCQSWLLLLKMAALQVCVPVIGACLGYSPCDWSYHVCPQPLCFFGKVWMSVFCLCKTQFSSVIKWLLSDYNPPSVFSSAQFWVYRCMWYCMLLCLCRLLCVSEGCVTWSIKSGCNQKF